MKPTILGKLVGFVLILGLIGIGAYVVMRSSRNPGAGPPAAGPTGTMTQNAQAAPRPTPPDTDPELVETLFKIKKLDAPQAYNPTDNTIVAELSEYGGYAGLIAFNNGLDPSENSGFFKNYGFKVHLTMSEAESWPALNAGKMAASATTTDVLAAYGKQFHVVVPAQIGFSRGADALVVTSDIGKVNDLRGKIVACCEFTESDFLIRYLAQDAGIPVNMLSDLKSRPDPDSINLVFCDTGEDACSLLLRDVQGGYGRVAGCTAWAPKTDEIVESSKGKLKVLLSNRNLLIISDILIVNEGFAKAHPEMVKGLVGGLIEGNRMVNDSPADNYDVIERAFKWEKGRAKDELAKVHLSNLPENLAYFSGAIDTAGSFDGIFESAVLAYGTKIVPNPVKPETFVNTKFLDDLKASGQYANQTIQIAPIKLTSGDVEHNPILSKNVRFLFQPNLAVLDDNDPANIQRVKDIQEMLKVSPGSTILLRGHVDDARKAEFARQGPDILRTEAKAAIKLSSDRADTVKALLVKNGIAADRIQTVGRGWEEPLGTDSDQNRRVEVQWFTLE